MVKNSQGQNFFPFLYTVSRLRHARLYTVFLDVGHIFPSLPFTGLAFIVGVSIPVLTQALNHKLQAYKELAQHLLTSPPPGFVLSPHFLPQVFSLFSEE